jgi:CheY-like chemotaxis protein
MEVGVPIQILLVEDSEADVELTREALVGSKVVNELHVVGDGEAAMDFLRRTGEYADCPRPDLVLLDLHMPGMDGYAFLDAFRGMPACAEVPVILMTGSQDTATARRRITAGSVVLLLPKPFDLGTLLAATRGAVHSSQPRGE